MSNLAPMKFFKFKHDKIILMHLQGMKNYEIADELGLTPQRIYQVLADPSAQLMIDKFRRAVRAKAHEDIETRMTVMGAAAVENIAETIEANVPVGSRIKKHQDDVSFKLLDRIGYTPKSDRVGEEAGMHMDRDMQERLVTALEQTKTVHAFDEAEEAEWQDVKEAASG